MNNVGKILWDFIMGLSSIMSTIWTFLQQDIEIGKIEILGIVITQGTTYNLLQVGSGGLIIAIITAGIISLFIP